MGNWDFKHGASEKEKPKAPLRASFYEKEEPLPVTVDSAVKLNGDKYPLAEKLYLAGATLYEAADRAEVDRTSFYHYLKRKRLTRDKSKYIFVWIEMGDCKYLVEALSNREEPQAKRLVANLSQRIAKVEAVA